MCLDKPAGTTGFLIAQQVTVNQGTTPALVIGAGSSIGTVKARCDTGCAAPVGVADSEECCARLKSSGCVFCELSQARQCTYTLPLLGSRCSKSSNADRVVSLPVQTIWISHAVSTVRGSSCPQVKLLHPQSVTICDLSIGSVSRLRCTFRRGDRVLRAVLSSPGTEEEAKVCKAAHWQFLSLIAS